MGMISFDTNVVLRFLLDDVPDQTVQVSKLIETEKVYVTDVVVVETVYVLEKVMLLERADICELVTGFLGLDTVVHNPYFLVEALAYYLKHTALSIVDCYALAEAEAYQNSLATFDQRLLKQGVGVTRLPG